MKTYEITTEELKKYKKAGEGFKAVEWNNGTKQSYKYDETGKSLIGRAFKVDGDISECKWGLHFSKDPANVFCFYEPLGYNKYFKVEAYEKVIDGDQKSVASIIKFVEEYELMEFIEIIKS